MIEKLLNEKSEMFNSIQALVSLVCESTSERGKHIINEQVGNVFLRLLEAAVCVKYSLLSTELCFIGSEEIAEINSNGSKFLPDVFFLHNICFFAYKCLLTDCIAASKKLLALR